MLHILTTGLALSNYIMHFTIRFDYYKQAVFNSTPLFCLCSQTSLCNFPYFLRMLMGIHTCSPFAVLNSILLCFKLFSFHKCTVLLFLILRSLLINGFIPANYFIVSGQLDIVGDAKQIVTHGWNQTPIRADYAFIYWNLWRHRYFRGDVLRSGVECEGSRMSLYATFFCSSNRKYVLESTTQASYN